MTNRDPAVQRWGPMALVVIDTPSHNQVMELPMIDERVCVADVLGQGVRLSVVIARRIEAFRIVSERRARVSVRSDSE